MVLNVRMVLCPNIVNRFAVLALASLLAATCTGQRTFSVTGNILQQAMPCDDVPAVSEEHDRTGKPAPYAGKTLYLRQGIVNEAKSPVVLKFTADKNGRFSFALSAGRYAVIQAEQLKPLDMKKFSQKPPLGVNEVCLREWWEKPLKVIEVTDHHIDSLEFRFIKRCHISSDIPCIYFSGPAADQK
jgi:hypothetical protein